MHTPCETVLTLYSMLIGNVELFRKVSPWFFNIVIPAGEIQYFLRHTVVVKNGDETHKVTHILAFVLWYKLHPQCKDYFGLSSQVCLQHYEDCSAASFMPVSRISHRCAASKVKYNLGTIGSESVVIVAPLERQFNM